MMTPKERRDAQIELKDMALELEQNQTLPSAQGWGEIERRRGQRWDRAALLRTVAAELDRVRDYAGDDSEEQ